ADHFQFARAGTQKSQRALSFHTAARHYRFFPGSHVWNRSSSLLLNYTFFSLLSSSGAGLLFPSSLHRKSSIVAYEYLLASAHSRFPVPLEVAQMRTQSRAPVRVWLCAVSAAL